MKRGALIAALLLASALTAQESSSKPSQTPTTKPKASASASSGPKHSIRDWKTYCSEEAAYCISYPPTWDVVGDVFEGKGVVIAPPQDNKPKSEWDEITASATDLPEEEPGQERPSFDEVITVALQDVPGKNLETLQRTELTLHKRPAQLVKVKYTDPETKKDWIEEIVFIDDEAAIYSIALRAVPNDIPELEEVFRTIISTWRPSEAPPAVPAPSAKPETKKPAPATKAPAKPPS